MHLLSPAYRALLLLLVILSLPVVAAMPLGAVSTLVPDGPTGVVFAQHHSCERGLTGEDGHCAQCALGGHAMGDRLDSPPNIDDPIDGRPSVFDQFASSATPSDLSQPRGPPKLSL